MKKLAVLGVVGGVVLAVILLVRKNQTSESPEEREARRATKNLLVEANEKGCPLENNPG